MGATWVRRIVGETVDEILLVPVAVAGDHPSQVTVLADDVDQTDVADHGEHERREAFQSVFEVRALGNRFSRSSKEGVCLGESNLVGIKVGAVECLSGLVSDRTQKVALVCLEDVYAAACHDYEAHARTSCHKG